jgi:hypothetical protein
MKTLGSLPGIAEKIKHIIHKIQSLDFSSLVDQNLTATSSADSYLAAARDYLEGVKGNSFTEVPENILEEIEIYGRRTFHVDVDLWVDGKLSDFTATFEIHSQGQDIRVRLYDLHVL